MLTAFMKSVAKLAAPSQQYCSETSLRHAPHSDMNTNLMLWSIYMLFLVCMLFMSLTNDSFSSDHLQTQ